MNTLLANGEVPGLFEGDEYTTLMTQCKEGSHRDGLMLDTPEELYRWFTRQVIRNLHVVFTMNPSTQGLKDRASTSPALFNRCVVNWCGDWSPNAMYQVGSELTDKVKSFAAFICHSLPIASSYMIYYPLFDIYFLFLLSCEIKFVCVFHR